MGNARGRGGVERASTRCGDNQVRVRVRAACGGGRNGLFRVYSSCYPTANQSTTERTEKELQKKNECGDGEGEKSQKENEC